jgi:hypothetical protein
LNHNDHIASALFFVRHNDGSVKRADVGDKYKVFRNDDTHQSNHIHGITTQGQIHVD